MIKRIGNIVLIQLSDIDSNIYLVGDCVIDSGTGFNFTRLFDVFRIIKKSPNDVKWVINTHCHYDHIGGNGYFLNAKIAIHETEAQVLEKADVVLSNAVFFNGKLHSMKVEKRLKEGDVLDGLKVVHTPGHSPGSICLYDPKEKILFSGDTIFSDGVGRTDIKGGDEEALAASLEKIQKIDIKKLLPGHGEPLLEKCKETIKLIVEG